MILGFDTNRRLTPTILEKLWALEYRFAIRYLRRQASDPSGLDRAEAELLHSMGFHIGCVFQHRATRPDMFTLDNANKDADAIIRRIFEIGMPLNASTYVAYDCDFLPSTIGWAVEYAYRIRELLHFEGIHRIGGYGDDLLIEELSHRDLIDDRWLCNAKAWINAKPFENWDMRQTSLPFAPIDGMSFELDNDEIRLTTEDGSEIANPWLNAGLWRYTEEIES